MIGSGLYECFVHYHSHVHRMHGTTAQRYDYNGETCYRRFLPWHRAYLISFERALRRINPALSIPYWDWLADQSAPGKNQLHGFDAVRGTIEQSRTLGTSIQSHRSIWNDIQGNLDALQKQTKYLTFARTLENDLHNSGHTWIGGDMTTSRSPRDPAFWFHHAQVDRVWAIWQKNNQGKMADLQGVEAEMDPWPQFTVESVNDTTNLGSDSYIYVD